MTKDRKLRPDSKKKKPRDQKGKMQQRRSIQKKLVYHKILIISKIPKRKKKRLSKEKNKMYEISKRTRQNNMKNEIRGDWDTHGLHQYNQNKLIN